MAKQTRYWPDDTYPLPEALLASMDEYHIIKVPLLGQHYDGGPHDWCGRTACSMVFNYYQMVQGGDFKSRFITHWDAGQGHYIDLRYPGGQRAFHKTPTESPLLPLDGAAVGHTGYTGGDVAVVQPPTEEQFKNGELNACHVLGFTDSQILPYNLTDPGVRNAEAAGIASSPDFIATKLALLLQALDANNPVIFYSGFSARKSDPIHLIVVCGYAWLVDSTGRHLWLVAADPATQYDKVDLGIFTAPRPGWGKGVDVEGLGELTGKHDLIRVVYGDYKNAQASLVLIRARKLFEPNTHSSISSDLYMDYWGDDPKKRGGTFLYSLKPTRVPPELLISSVTRPVAFPMDGQKSRIRPVNGYAMTEQAGTGLFPLGSHRNLHSGVHLGTSQFESAQAASPKPVRCLAPGYVVAVRLANALPEPSLEEKAKAGLKQNELSRQFAGNHNSFILVRHDVEESLTAQEEKDGKQPQRFTFYSLYMHLVPPDWSQEDTYRDVAWLKTLARRDGCLTVIDPRNEAFKQVGWLQGPLGGATAGEDTELALLRGGTLQVMGAGLGQPRQLQLGDGGDIYRAVLKKTDRDLNELHEALTGGKVVTLSHPYLKVRTGDVLGYVDEARKALGDGFLHWEILAPGDPGQLQQFLSFAEEKLGLSEGGQPFFRFFEEKDQNNFFDPPVVREGQSAQEPGELDELLALSPLSKHAGEPGEELLKSLQETYSQELLQELLASARKLPFTAADDAASDEPSYPVDVHIENYKNCLPQGSYTLRFTFEPSSLPAQEVAYDGKQASVRVQVPGRATKLFVEAAEPGSLHFQAGNSVGKRSLEQDVAHFRNVAGVRWRNVVLRHLNEWHPGNIFKQVQENLKERKLLRLGSSVLDAAKEEEARPIIQEYANAVGWWAHEETAVLGPEDGGEKPLFAGGPDAEQLPADTLLDNPHPITFTWLLLLLTRHGLIRFTDTPQWRSDEQKKVAAVGWLPAREQQAPQRVGELVYAAAVQRGEGDEPVTLRVKQGEWTLDLAGGRFKDGLFAAPVELPGWGRWTLDAPGAQALGSLELTGLAPSLLKASAPPGEDGSQSAETDEVPDRRDDGTYAWRIGFRENCPRLLRGWVLLSTWKGKPAEPVPTEASAFTPSGWAIPVLAREDAVLKEESGTVVADGLLRKGTLKDPATYVTGHFTYKAFITAAGGQAEPVLAWDLVEAVERIQCAYSAKQLVTLSALAADGLSLQLTASNLERLRAAVARAKDEGRIEDAEEAGKGVIRIRVRPPAESRHPGELVLTFDAGAAFAELRKGLSHDEQLAVRFGCFFPNGGGAQDHRLQPSESIGKLCEPVRLQDLKREAQGGALELWSTRTGALLHQPRFGEPEHRLTSEGVQFCVPLLGAPESFWKAAKPTILFDQERLDKTPQTVLMTQPPRLVRVLKFSDPKLKNPAITFVVARAVAQQKAVPLQAERIDVPDSTRLRYELGRDAVLETAPRPDDPFILTVTLATNAVPSGTGFKLEISKPGAPVDAKTKRPVALKLPTTCIRYKLPGKGAAYGQVDAEGLMRAEVNVTDVSAALAGEKRFELRAVPAGDAGKGLERSTTCDVPEPLHPGMEEDATQEDFNGMYLEGMSPPMKGERVGY